MRLTLISLAAVMVACSPLGQRAASPTPSASVSSSPAATASPSAPASPTPTASPAPARPAVVVYDATPGQASYRLSVVAADGSVLAKADASGPGTACGAGAASFIAPPPIATSASRVYFVDGASLKWLDEAGHSGTAIAQLPAGAAAYYAFAPAPDDSAVFLNAIVVGDPSDIRQRLFNWPVGAAGGKEVFTATGTPVLWPEGWRSGGVALGLHGGCMQGGAGSVSLAATEVHLVDPTTADRRATIGSSGLGSCGALTLPTAAGFGCGDPMQPSVKLLDWTGSAAGSFNLGWTEAGLSPAGTRFLGLDATGLAVIGRDGAKRPVPGGGVYPMWIDEEHFLIGFPDRSKQPVVYSAITMEAVPAAVAGRPVARLPALLDPGRG